MNFEEFKNQLRQGIESLRSKHGYLNAGYPRYNTLFGRDSIISAWQMLQIDPSIAKATLLMLSKFQGRSIDPKSEEEPGKILHEYRFDPQDQAELCEWKFPYYGSIDSTPLFIILAEKYLKETNDIRLISQIWENLLAALTWIIQHGDTDGDGYIEYQRKNPYGLFHQGWRDSSEDSLKIKPPVAIVEAQGYVYTAYYSIISIMEAINKNKDKASEEIRKRAILLKKKFNQDFWMPREKYLALALDGTKKQKKVVSSNAGHLLFTGIVDDDKRDFVINRLFQKDMWTPYGIRTHSVLAPDYNPYSYHLGSIWPQDNWIIYTGLQKFGYFLQAEKIKQALLRTYKELHKIPEYYIVIDNRIIDPSIPTKNLFYVRANPLQAWANAALLEMLINE
ncbi:MAG: amylo-alpha-1,6-glucosidase [Candidatus Heimdallarchaeota archaeon]